MADATPDATRVMDISGDKGSINRGAIYSYQIQAIYSEQQLKLAAKEPYQRSHQLFSSLHTTVKPVSKGPTPHLAKRFPSTKNQHLPQP
jgi:hypothetical protein